MISSYPYCALGLALSAEIGALIYMECSAIKSEGLDEVKFSFDNTKTVIILRMNI